MSNNILFGVGSCSIFHISVSTSSASRMRNSRMPKRSSDRARLFPALGQIANSADNEMTKILWLSANSSLRMRSRSANQRVTNLPWNVQGISPPPLTIPHPNWAGSFRWWRIQRRRAYTPSTYLGHDLWTIVTGQSPATSNSILCHLHNKERKLDHGVIITQTCYRNLLLSWLILIHIYLNDCMIGLLLYIQLFREIALWRPFPVTQVEISSMSPLSIK